MIKVHFINMRKELFSDKRKVRFEQQANGVTIDLDDISQDKIDTIVQLEI